MNTFSVFVIALIAVPFLLFFLRIIILCWQNYALARQLKILEQLQAAHQQAEASYTTTCNGNNNNNNNNNDNTAPKEFDLPPAYDEVVQSYMMAKQEQSQENNLHDGVCSGERTNTSSNNLSTAVSTLTIETDIVSSNNASAINLNHATTSETSNPSASAQSPSYAHSTEICATKQNNDHIV